MNSILARIFRLLLALFLLLGTAGGIGAIAAYVYIAPSLPSIEVLKDVRLQVPLRIYTRDGQLIAEYGEMKRTPLSYQQVPPRLVQAFLAAEDDRFFDHPGVDYQGIIRAAVHLLRTGEKGQGGSTITMQVARNFFLSREKTYLRKVSEILLALKIERELSKAEILELYLNKIYLGHRAYGVGAAAQVYYGKGVDELDLPQLAMIAGLPKAPSRYNPITDAERAVIRRDYVLRRMHTLEFIDDATYAAALEAPVTAEAHGLRVEVEAPYVAEMVRSELVERYGPDAYNRGLQVHTTIDGRLQEAANAAVREALLAYDERHGYRGPEHHVELTAADTPAHWQTTLADYGEVGGLAAALVTGLDEQRAHIVTAEGEQRTIGWEGLAWAQPYIDERYRGEKPESAADVLSPGDIIRIRETDDGPRLAQVPQVSGALVSLNPHDGAVLALVGGFDYFHSKFNRATQAERQPGSNFKPFVYSAALDKGFTPASLINDAPVVFEDAELEASWRPENYSGRFYGPTRLREALINSRNLVSIRLLRAIGVDYALDYLTRFGFERQQLPRNLSLALGSASIRPYDLARGYAVIANGGFLVENHVIDRIVDIDGTVVSEHEPLVACDEACQAEAQREATPRAAPVGPPAPAVRAAPRTLTPQNVYLITSMMRDVVKHGTGRRALVLGRDDLAGKTGTTNEQRDAWFSGFNADVVTTTWVGFDTPRPLGPRETGARAALPMWIAYMREALAGVPERPLKQPPGIVTVRIDPETGRYAPPDASGAIFEVFRAENAPAPSRDGGDNGGEGNLTEQLF